MKKKKSIEKFKNPFTGQVLTFTIDDELDKEAEKMRNSPFIRRKMERANEFVRRLSPKDRALLGLAPSPTPPANSSQGSSTQS
jgi:hypothetical protein